jgi:hypothetical protein
MLDQSLPSKSTGRETHQIRILGRILQACRRALYAIKVRAYSNVISPDTASEIFDVIYE